ncbi:MAG: family 20 glycosylhydrolase [Kiritimatiellaeota bacterium]|nr:family 20 glycosylhydrolase [Kiritimatiellota bacterium]
MVSNLSIIPEPKRILHRKGCFVLKDQVTVFYTAASGFAKNILEEELALCKVKNISFSKVPAKSHKNLSALKAIVIADSKFPDDLQAFRDTLSQITIEPEGYIIDVNSGRIILVADDDAGLFYACQTLFQIIGQEGKTVTIPAVRIEDAPEMKIRGAQIELSFLMPSFAMIESLLKTYARYKINTVLISYLDKFKFDKHPLISHPDALSKDQIRRLDALARSLHIKLVPILQCFGHAENILKHPQYAHLREGKDIHTQFCPENPGSLALFKEMAGEMLEVHSSRCFHIGADEAYYLGSCPKCKPIAAKEGKVGLFLKYVNKVCAFLVAQGKTPVLWDDILCKSPSKLKKLHPKAAITYWDYAPADPQNPFVYFRGEGYYCNKQYWKAKKWWGGDFVHLGNCRDFKDLPPERMKHYRPYFTSTNNLNYIHPFPFYKFYQDSGYPTIGCPAVRGGEYSYIIPDYTRRMSNILQMIRVAAENNGLGVINTSWSEMASPEELALYPMIATAEFAWSCGRLSPATFDQKFSRQFFGMPDTRLIAAMKTVGARNPPLCFCTGERADLCAKGDFAPTRGSYKTLLDKRIASAFSAPELPDLLAELARLRTATQDALNVLNELKRQVVVNKEVFHHLVLAARNQLHKIEQFFIFQSAEKKVHSVAPIAPRERKQILAQLAKLAQDARHLKRANEKLFSKTYTPSSVRSRSAMMFEGELEKMRDYRGLLQKGRIGP